MFFFQKSIEIAASISRALNYRHILSGQFGGTRVEEGFEMAQRKKKMGLAVSKIEISVTTHKGNTYREWSQNVIGYEMMRRRQISCRRDEERIQESQYEIATRRPRFVDVFVWPNTQNGGHLLYRIRPPQTSAGSHLKFTYRSNFG